MNKTRPSGILIIPDSEALIIQEVAEIEERGRLNILPRWAKKAGWLPVTGAKASEALMIFIEPGLLSIRSWEPDGPRIFETYKQVAQEEEPDLEALRLIQDRYGKLSIPKDRRPYLGDAALQHLGLPTTRTARSNIYVVVSLGRIDLLSPNYRNTKNIGGHSLLDDLP